MQLFVVTLPGKTIALEVEPSTTAEGLKARVEDREGVPPQHQRLLSCGRALEGPWSLAELGVQPDSTLHLALGLRGGMGGSSKRRHDDSSDSSSDSSSSDSDSGDERRKNKKHKKEKVGWVYILCPPPCRAGTSRSAVSRGSAPPAAATAVIHPACPEGVPRAGTGHQPPRAREVKIRAAPSPAALR